MNETTHIEEKFFLDVEKVKSLTKRPSNEELLCLYGLFKQSTHGNNNGKKPGILKVKERAKFESWSELEGMEKQEAMKQYSNLVEELLSKYQ